MESGPTIRSSPRCARASAMPRCPPPDLAGFAATLRARLTEAAGDTERRMNLLREAHQAQVFRLLAQDLAGLLTVERLADHLSAAADLVLELTIDCAWADLPRKH